MHLCTTYEQLYLASFFSVVSTVGIFHDLLWLNFIRENPADKKMVLLIMIKLKWIIFDFEKILIWMIIFKCFFNNNVFSPIFFASFFLSPCFRMECCDRFPRLCTSLIISFINSFLFLHSLFNRGSPIREKCIKFMFQYINIHANFWIRSWK